MILHHRTPVGPRAQENSSAHIAQSVRSNRITPVPVSTPLLVQCWCRAAFVKTSQRDVWAGVGVSCGRSDCHPPTDADGFAIVSVG